MKKIMNINKYILSIIIISIGVLLFQIFVSSLEFKKSILDIVFRIAVSGIITVVAEQYYMKYHRERVFLKWWFRVYFLLSVGVVLYYFIRPN